MVNNAGILRDKMIFNMEVEEWDAVIKVHLRGHFLVTREACRHWRGLAKAGEPAGGRIVNTSSTSGILGNIGQSNYGAAKAGIAAFSQIVAMEMAKYGVTCNAIAPGADAHDRAHVRRPVGSRGAVRRAGPRERRPARRLPLHGRVRLDQRPGVRGPGGIIQLYQGWTIVEQLAKDERWEVGEIADRVDELFAGRDRVYHGNVSSFRDAAGIEGGGSR